jgi:glycerate 2-kinase
MPGKIQNFRKLATTELRQALLEITEAGLGAIDTKNVIKDEVSLEGDELEIKGHRYSLSGVSNLYIFGAGKCVLEATEALEEVLGDRLTGGLILDVRVPKNHLLRKVKCVEGTHPVPSSANVRASKQMMKKLKKLGEGDMVIFVISGGGSALLCLPGDEGSFKDEASIQRALSEQGAEIGEINTVRKHLSLVRGGYLAEYIYPVRAVSIIFSDVPGNELEFVASGPTVKDETTIADAEIIIKKYDVLKKSKLTDIHFIETPKEDRYFANIDNILLISNERALKAMAEKARDLGYDTEIVTDCMKGEAREVARDIMNKLHDCHSKTVLLYGGETTVTITVKGEGGRNRELIVAALLLVEEKEGMVSVASDGRDNGNHAGAVADMETFKHASERGLDVGWHLENNQSARFFEKTGDYIMTGDTGSNVSDLVIALKN